MLFRSSLHLSRTPSAGYDGLRNSLMVDMGRRNIFLIGDEPSKMQQGKVNSVPLGVTVVMIPDYTGQRRIAG
jgi:hypothetical protein